MDRGPDKGAERPAAASAATDTRGRRTLLPADSYGDIVLATACIVGTLVICALLYGDVVVPAPAPHLSARPSVGVLAAADGEVRRRPTQTLLWDVLRAGDVIYDLDALFVAPGSAASVALDEGARLELEENTLIVFEAVIASPDAAKGQVSLALSRGAIAGRTSEQPLRVRAGGATALLSPEADAEVDMDAGAAAHIDVFSGSVTLETPTEAQRLDANRSAVVASDGMVTTPSEESVTLLEPERNARIYFVGSPPVVRLTWRAADGKPRRVQVASDRRFSRLVRAQTASQGEYELRAPRAGTYYWRVVGMDGAGASHARRLVLVEDRPAQCTRPANGAALLAKPRARQLFTWTAVGSAPAYHFELAREPTFQAPVAIADVIEPQVWVRAPTELGTYYWRVRVADPARGESPYSAVVKFELVGASLPPAPELLNARIEVDE